MTVLSRDREELLEQLVSLAGDAEVVKDVLRDLNAELRRAPKLEEIVSRILEVRHNGTAHGAASK